jgi:hypothetical protein
MTNKLSDYDLQRGDWVKFVGSEWLEYEGFDDFKQPRLITNNYLKTNMVEAVLRPSVIVRDELDEALKYQLTYNPQKHVSYQQNLSFKIIHPKQEKTTLFDDLKVHDIQIESDNSLSANIFKVISRRFQKLEDQIDRLKEKVK